VILGVANQLETKHKPDTEESNQLRLIRRNGNNLLQLINQILDLSKLENNELQVSYVQDNIVKYIDYITESFHTLANGRNIMLKVQAQKGEILIMTRKKYGKSCLICYLMP